MDTKPDLSVILEKLDCIDKHMKRLSNTMEDLNERCVAIESSTDRMDTHIDFVTRTYMYLRSPLMTFKGVTNRIGSVFLSARGAPRPQSIINNETNYIEGLGDSNELPLPPANQYPDYEYNDNDMKRC